jgi:hypothetical protein
VRYAGAVDGWQRGKRSADALKPHMKGPWSKRGGAVTQCRRAQHHLRATPAQDAAQPAVRKVGVQRDVRGAESECGEVADRGLYPVLGEHRHPVGCGSHLCNPGSQPADPLDQLSHRGHWLQERQPTHVGIVRGFS